MHVFDAKTAEWKVQEQTLPSPLFSHGCNEVTLKDGRNGILTVGGFTTEGVPAVKLKSKPRVLCKPHYGNSRLEMEVCKWEAPH